MRATVTAHGDNKGVVAIHYLDIAGEYHEEQLNPTESLVVDVAGLGDVMISAEHTGDAISCGYYGGTHD